MNAAYSAYREIKIAENKKRRLRIVRRQRRILAAAVAFFIFFVVFISVTTVLSAHSEKGRYKYYTSVTVKSGDSLSGIAKEYISDDYEDTASYIREVCAINHIDEDEIMAGENIIVPYFSEEYK